MCMRHKPVKLHSVYEDEISFGSESRGLLISARTTNHSGFSVTEQLQVGVGQEVKCNRITHLQKKLKLTMQLK